MSFIVLVDVKVANKKKKMMENLEKVRQGWGENCLNEAFEMVISSFEGHLFTAEG
jgi:hypothetical protein